MPESIKCQNRPIPAYSGITINITNPVLNAAPLQGCGQNTEMDSVGINVSQQEQPINYQNDNKYMSNNISNMSPDAYYSKAEIEQQYKTQREESPKNKEHYSQSKQDLAETASDKQVSEVNNTQNTSSIEKESIKQSIIESSTNSNNKQQANADYNKTVGESPAAQQNYPAAYYINNYNDNRRNPNEGINPTNNNEGIDPNAGKYNNMSNTDELSDMTVSKEIIEEIDAKNAEQKELEANSKQTKVVALTNEYIMSLENYLNNPNTDIRLMAAKDILTRLDEDHDRYDDAALNALLNKMLQDPAKLVRVAALSALAADLASGNDYTVQILNRIQQDPKSDQQDILDAAQILLNRSATTEIRYIEQDNKEQAEQ